MKKYFQHHPLRTLLLIGFTVRILAAIFSKGFLTLDDHFNLVVDADLLASGEVLPKDYKDSILYPLVVSFMMKGTRLLGISSPDTEMLFVRLFHAGISLFSIYFVYKILERKSNSETANLGGLLMATFFIFPFTSVHQFEESLSQIPLLASLWFVVKNKNEVIEEITEQQSSISFVSRDFQRWNLFLAGVFLGIALILRFPLLSFVLPFSVILLFISESRKHFIFFLFGLTLVVLLQAVSNVSTNGEFGYSFKRNYGFLFSRGQELMQSASGYPSGPPWRYAETLLAVFLPPFSILFFVAVFRSGKKYLLLSLPAMIFFLAHSLIANKQERFLLPILPVLIILGVAGFSNLKNWFEEYSRRWKTYKALWFYFLAVNTILLCISLFMYGKKDRVEPFVYIERQKNVSAIIVAQFNYEFLVPEYYLGKPMPKYFIIGKRKQVSALVKELSLQQETPRYLVLYSNSVSSDISLLEESLRKKLIYETTISPGIGDYLANKMNPKYNKANTALIYRIE
ncbi:MAG: hypothetical protein KGZ58_09685 [Ignavibacteriales bacterium]|nr:hypothetical protein [Ignavibacteriales bacterium]